MISHKTWRDAGEKRGVWRGRKGGLGRNTLLLSSVKCEQLHLHISDSFNFYAQMIKFYLSFVF